MQLVISGRRRTKHRLHHQHTTKGRAQSFLHTSHIHQHAYHVASSRTRLKWKSLSGHLIICFLSLFALVQHGECIETLSGLGNSGGPDHGHQSMAQRSGGRNSMGHHDDYDWTLRPPDPTQTSAVQLTGRNVCSKQESYTQSVMVNSQQPYQLRTYSWCFSIPPKCSRYKIQMRVVSKIEMLTKHRTVSVCCQGYVRSSNGTTCVPTCSQGCKHGNCVAPDVCECWDSFGGKDCSKSCEKGFWGPRCENRCPCLNGASCDPVTGKCSCGPGWQGDRCERKCDNYRFGQDCQEVCKCQNGAQCDPVSGACSCAPGWKGALCEEPCPPGKHGANCTSACNCQNHGSCNPVTGKCYCPMGWTGAVCANPCPPGTYDVDCKRTCDCYNGAVCDHVNGKCHCLRGYQGDKCEEQCPFNMYGQGCAEKCRCARGVCHPVDGQCSCPPGWKGRHCEIRACDKPDLYGPSCSQVCRCNPQYTDMCDPWTGECICRPGYAGKHCHRPCPLYKYGSECKEVCTCQNGAFCNPVDGSCTCAPGYLGANCTEICPAGKYGHLCRYECQCKNGAKCQTTSGKCDCAPGWSGVLCDTPCPAPSYGEECKNECTCKNGGSCHHITGQCTCPSGYKGKDCEVSCERGKYGINCAYECDCDSDHSVGCNAETGKCNCKPGWRGERCDSICVPGNWGPDCSRQCQCDQGGSCDPETGECRCPPGFTGSRCDTLCESGKYGVGCKQACPPCNSSYPGCDYVTGECECMSGYTGYFCMKPCPKDTWGRRCVGRCSCKNEGDCYHVTGECRCPGGWTGSDCSEPCQKGKFGPNCAHDCYCHNDATCNPVDGRCKCKPGYYGSRCEQLCPEGYFGQDCDQACQCVSTNSLCHPTRGCECQPGYDGANCSIPDAFGADISFSSPDGSSLATEASKVATIFIVIIFVAATAIVIGLAVCYKRRFHRLKQEFANVQYSANQEHNPDREDDHLYETPSQLKANNTLSTTIYSTPDLESSPGCSTPIPHTQSNGGSPHHAQHQQKSAPDLDEDEDGHHFDNPVYTTYRPASPNSSHLAEPLNNLRMMNVSTKLKNINSERERAAASAACQQYLDDDDLSDCTSERGVGCTGNAFSYSSLHRKKTLDADAANPNIYTALEDDIHMKDNRKLENAYEELHNNRGSCSHNSNASDARSSERLSERDSIDLAGGGEAYDRLNFSRARTELRPDYHSTTTLRSQGSMDCVGDSGISSALSSATVPWSAAPGIVNSNTVVWGGSVGQPYHNAFADNCVSAGVRSPATVGLLGSQQIIINPDCSNQDQLIMETVLSSSSGTMAAANNPGRLSGTLPRRKLSPNPPRLRQVAGSVAGAGGTAQATTGTWSVMGGRDRTNRLSAPWDLSSEQDVIL